MARKSRKRIRRSTRRKSRVKRRHRRPCKPLRSRRRKPLRSRTCNPLRSRRRKPLRSILKGGKSRRKGLQMRKRRRKIRRVHWGGAAGVHGENIPMSGNANIDKVNVMAANMSANMENTANIYTKNVQNS